MLLDNIHNQIFIMTNKENKDKPKTLKDLESINDDDAQNKHNNNVNVESNAWRQKNFYHR